jgi:Mn2+/Fe2+ NRAMP family transporter
MRGDPHRHPLQHDRLAVALTLAFFVNAAILVLAAMVFYGKSQRHEEPAGRRTV